MDIKPYLKFMVDKGASDIFFTVDSLIKVKLEGKLIPLNKTLLTDEMCQTAAFNIMSDEQIQTFKETMEYDFAISPEGIQARFRVNVFRQKGFIGMVLRLIPSDIPSIAQMNLPEILSELIILKRGLLLMVGGTGSGKSTTLAAMVNHRNTNLSGHILTIEDPIEFSHPNIKSIINQREVGVDTLSYRNALKASLREAPDVILVGEIRDRETMESTLELANTGHLALSTLHANNANQAMERVINMFPQDAHKQLLMDLSVNIKAIVSQRLVLGVDSKRCAAMEILINTPHIAELILQGDLEEIKAAMEESGKKGMQTFDMALLSLYKQSRISIDEALDNADSRTNLEAKINFG